MRVLFDANPLIPLTPEQGPRGIGRWTKAVISRLAELEPGWELEGILFRSPFSDLIDTSWMAPNVKVRSIGLSYSLFRRLRTLAWLPSAESSFGPFDAFLGPDFITWPCRRAAEIPVIHDLIPIKFPDYVSRKHHWFIRLLLPRVIRRAALIVTDATSIAEEIAKMYPGTRARLRPIPCGFGEDQFVGGSSPPPAGVPERYLLFVGTREPRKNLGRVIEAIRIAAENRDIPPLVVVGAGSRLTGDEPAEGVHLLGYVPDEAMKSLYSMAEALVFPSLYEGFGLTVLEAMGAGCPVITSQRGGLPEAAGEAAVYVDPEDPADIARGILAILDDPALRARLKSEGRARAARFTWDRTAQELRDAIVTVTHPDHP